MVLSFWAEPMMKHDCFVLRSDGCAVSKQSVHTRRKTMPDVMALLATERPLVLAVIGAAFGVEHKQPAALAAFEAALVLCLAVDGFGDQLRQMVGSFDTHGL